MVLALLLAVEGQSEGAPIWASFIWMLPVMALFYFLMIRPGQTQEKQRKALLSALKKNDKIVNSGGIIGTVESIKEKEDEVVLKGGLRITKSSVVRITTDDATNKEGGG